MTTSRVASELAALLVPIGVVGAVLAGLCAVVAGIAIVRGASGLTGGAVGVWIPFALMSLLAGFGNQWIPVISAGAALIAMLIIGTVVRAMVTASGYERAAKPVATVEADAVSDAVATTRPVAVVTGGVQTLGRAKPPRVA